MGKANITHSVFDDLNFLTTLRLKNPETDQVTGEFKKKSKKIKIFLIFS